MCFRLIASLVGLIFVMTLVATPSPAFAQSADASQDSGIVSGPRKQLAIIIFAGLAGAILGLSTLSFYGRPQEKLSNIAVGFAVGIIVGTSYTTYKAATAPYEFIGDNSLNHSLDEASLTRGSLPYGATYSWTF